ncbi:MAG TPA: amidohydrolase family protein [Opitutaceae bacterium]|nr:amidohydrolase family protein [Opitutaceae bacterium]
MRTLVVFLLLALCCSVGRSVDLALLHANVYAGPDSAPLADATVLIRDGKIVAVGEQVVVPKETKTLDVQGCTVLAGFWNTHVHFVEPKWADAAHLPAAKLEGQLQDMLTHSGFTTVVDTGSDPVNTIALRRRIESGEVRGPHVYTAGIPLYPPHALPYYLKDLPEELRSRLSQPETPAQAVAAVQQNIAAGTDIVKLFTGSIVAPDRIVPMSVPIASAAVTEAHRHHQLVFAHATNFAGMNAAMESGVDVIAHAPELLEGVDERYLQTLVAHHMALIPTLQLFSQDKNIADIRKVVLRFHRLGGRLMFGTDTGFLSEYDMRTEYRQLSLAGLNFREIIAMLTTAPAECFGVAKEKGRVAPGQTADLTILSADPGAGDLLAFARVKYTIRAGRIIFIRPQG